MLIIYNNINLAKVIDTTPKIYLKCDYCFISLYFEKSYKQIKTSLCKTGPRRNNKLVAT